MSTLDAHGLFTDDAGLMTTFTGRRVNPLTMSAADVDIYDIAHSLARQCRYNGHVVGFLSVARHCVWVAEHLADRGCSRETVLAGLLHDAAEAYMGDMIRPLKHGPTGEAYLSAEARLEAEIAAHFGLPYPFPPAVTEADNHVLTARELAHPDGARYTWTSSAPDDEREFLCRFDALVGSTR